MKWILPVALTVVSLSIPSTAHTAAGDGVADLAGVYVCNGVNPDGAAYQGLVQIIKVHDAFELRWMFGRELAAVGIGIRSGSVLAVTYFSGVPGVVAYKIGSDSKLIGEWTVVGSDGVLFKETLTKAPNQKLPDIAPSEPDGDQPPAANPHHPREPTRGTRSI